MNRNLWLKIPVSVLLMAWIIHRVDLGQVLALGRQVRWLWVAAAFCSNLLGFFINSQRWRILLAAQKISASTRLLFKSYLVGTFFNQFLPSSIGGDIVRAMDLGPQCGSLTRSLSIIVFDRFVGIAVLYLFACVGILFLTPDLKGGLVWSLAAFGLAVAGLIWLFKSGGKQIDRLERLTSLPLVSKVIGKLSTVRENLGFYCTNLRPTAKVVFLALVLQLNVIVAYYFLSQAYATRLGLGPFFVMVPIILFGTMLPISINGIGLREGLFVYLFTSFGVPDERALAVAWTLFAMQLTYGLVGGLVYALRRQEVLPGTGGRAGDRQE